jgi:biotin carboxyl carrier protein
MNIGLNRLDPNVPDPVESRRRASGRFVRITYGAGIFGLLAVVIVYFGAPLVFLGGPGVVSAPRQVVSLPYFVQVTHTSAAPGDKIGAGDEIAQVRSPQHDEIVASYMRALVELAGREAELRIRARVARDSLEAARSYLQLTEQAVKRLESAHSTASASLNYRIEILSARAQALKAVVSPEAEAAEASVQIESLSALHQRLQQHLDRIERDFANGRVVAPVAGIVSRPIAQIGQSLAAGTAIAEIYDTTDIFVDWYVPNHRLVDPRVGNDVLVLFGNRRIPGAIAEILPLSDVLGAPRSLGRPDLQSAQIARIRFGPGMEPPALNSIIQVHMFYTNTAARIAAALVDLLGLR